MSKVINTSEEKEEPLPQVLKQNSSLKNIPGVQLTAARDIIVETAPSSSKLTVKEKTPNCWNAFLSCFSKALEEAEPVLQALAVQLASIATEEIRKNSSLSAQTKDAIITPMSQSLIGISQMGINSLRSGLNSVIANNGDVEAAIKQTGGASAIARDLISNTLNAAKPLTTAGSNLLKQQVIDTGLGMVDKIEGLKPEQKKAIKAAFKESVPKTPQETLNAFTTAEYAAAAHIVVCSGQSKPLKCVKKAVNHLVVPALDAQGKIAEIKAGAAHENSISNSELANPVTIQNTSNLTSENLGLPNSGPFSPPSASLEHEQPGASYIPSSALAGDTLTGGDSDIILG